MPLSSKRRKIQLGSSGRSVHREHRRRALRRLGAEMLERRILLTTVTGVDPLEGSHNVATSTDVSATFDQAIAPATDQTFVVHSQQSGQLIGTATTVSTAGTVATHDPAVDFFPGERLQATVTGGLATAGGPHVWQFRTAVGGGLGTFVDSGQVLGVAAQNDRNLGLEVGDLDADGDLDIFMTSFRYLGSQIFLNDGGNFTNSGQSLGQHDARDVSFGDVDGDGDLDAVMANSGGQGNIVWQNDGSAVFSEFQTFGNQSSREVRLGDLDGDGDLDAFVANDDGGDRAYLNDGSGSFSAAGSALGSDASIGVDLADVDSDGDLDAFVVSGGTSPTGVDRVWINDGSGAFTDSGQNLGPGPGQSVRLADLDGDGDLDAFVSEFDEFNLVYFNDGSGVFTDSGQAIGVPVSTFATRSNDVKLGDLDADGDLDAFVANSLEQGNRVYLNDGAGIFTNSGQILGAEPAANTYAVALGDIDGDGDLDAVTANDNNLTNTLSVGRIWVNQNPTTSVSLAIDAATIAEAAGSAAVTASLSAAHAQAVTIDLGFSGSATDPTDYTISGNQIVIAAGETTGSISITAVDDADDEPDETVVVDITGVTNAQEAGVQQAAVIILDDDEPVVPDVALSVDNDAVDEAGGTATFTATLSEVTTAPVTVNLALSGTATAGADYTASGNQIVIAAGSSSGSITVTSQDDDEDEPDETVIVDIDSVIGGNEAGTQQQTTTITDDDAPPGFTVTSLTATESGFVAQFANDLDPSGLNLYDTQNLALGAADAALVGASSGPVGGSLIVDDELRSVTFIKAGGPLAPDSYTVTLRSGEDAFKDAGGQPLDGNGDGTAGDDYVSSFAVAQPTAGTVTLSIPDFTRGPGQAVNLPADTTNGIPVTISDGDNVRAVDLRIGYDPSKLSITGATVSADAPPGATVVANTTTPGLAILVFFSSASLRAGSSTLVNLQATVPTENAGDVYGTQQVLDLHAAAVSDGNDNEAPVQVDDAVQLVSYFSDVSGNGRVNAADASQVARFAALIDSGFAGSVSTDPILAGDVSGNNRINAADASLVARFAALIDVPEIPAVPTGILTTGVTSLDPLNLGPTNLETTSIIASRHSGPPESGNTAASFALDFRVVENLGSATANIDRVAVDRMMADLANSENDEQGELASASLLADMIDELFSAVE